MKLLLTILLGLLLVQAVVGLHLHTEGEDSGNSTATVEVGNVTATVDVKANATAKSEEEQKLLKIQKNYEAIEASGDEDHISAARKVRAEFEDEAAETKQKIEAASKLSDDPTDQERQAGSS